MPEVTLQTFVDYVNSDPIAKAKAVRNALEIYEAEDDEFAFRSYYLPLKRATKRYFADGGDREVLSTCAAAMQQPARRNNYEDCIKGLHKFYGRRRRSTFQVAKRSHILDELTVVVNPEIGLVVGSVPHVVKLHFKQSPLVKRRVAPALRLMEVTHGEQGVPAILDVRRSRLHVATRMPRDIDAILAVEGSGLARYWELLSTSASVSSAT